jgi:uncharacterized protein (TIGR00251 family)
LSRAEDCAASWNGDDLILRISVQPRASRDEILGVRNGRLRVRTTAAPTDGKANKATIRLLANYLNVAPSRITLTHGETHRSKRIVVSGPVIVPDDLRVAT